MWESGARGRNGDKLIYIVTSLSITVHTVRKRESNDTDLAVPGGARPPCCCWNFPFSGTTAVVQQMLSAGGQVEHRTLSLGHKCMAVKLRGSSSALSPPPSTLLPTSWRDWKSLGGTFLTILLQNQQNLLLCSHSCLRSIHSIRWAASFSKASPPTTFSGRFALLGPQQRGAGRPKICLNGVLIILN